MPPTTARGTTPASKPNKTALFWEAKFPHQEYFSGAGEIGVVEIGRGVEAEGLKEGMDNSGAIADGISCLTSTGKSEKEGGLISSGFSSFKTWGLEKLAKVGGAIVGGNSVVSEALLANRSEKAGGAIAEGLSISVSELLKGATSSTFNSANKSGNFSDATSSKTGASVLNSFLFSPSSIVGDEKKVSSPNKDSSSDSVGVFNVALSEEKEDNSREGISGKSPKSSGEIGFSSQEREGV
jgi:hypothetical protein